MDLIQQLKDGETGSDGVRRPPTRLALMAGRKLQELLNVVQGLEISLNQERLNVENLLNENYLIKEQNAKLIHESTSLRDGGREVSQVGIGDGTSKLSGSDQPSETSPEPQDSSHVSGSESPTGG